MEKKEIVSLILHIIGTAAIVVLSVLLFRSCHKQPEVIERTVTLTDTIYQERIVEHTKLKYVSYTDTAFINTKDTIFVGDTIRVDIPISHYCYNDTIDNDSVKTAIDIDYFGYNAGIEKIGVTNQITYKKAAERKSGFGHGIGLSINAGYGIGYYDGTIKPTPYIGVGLSYNIGYFWLK